MQNSDALPTRSPVVNISAYKFVRISDPEERREQLRALTQKLDLRGTVLLSPEGINLFVAGGRANIDLFVAALKSDPLLDDLAIKESLSDYQPFNRMLVKLRNEIIALGIEGIDPIRHPTEKLPPRELKRWLDEGRPVHLLDVRNDYEIDIGSFAGAVPAKIDHFREFSEAVKRLPESMKHEPVVMFCTGGLRCEKAGPYMEQAGFTSVFQLEGGILRYFEECGSDHYQGDCFVFDQRVAVDASLKETGFTQCYVCQAVVSPQQQLSSQYVPGQSCPACWQEPSEQLIFLLRRRMDQLTAMTDPLPGSEPYFNHRPLNVPQRYDGFRLIDFLCDWHPHIGRNVWLGTIAASRIIPSPRYSRRARRKRSAEEQLPLHPDRAVRGGERLEHLLPGTVEPDVNPNVEILFEDDELIVVNKPAPLPLHPSGQFNRNTLQFFLRQLYRPQRPLLVHRLDANTTGVLVLCRKRSVARLIQPQFEQRTVHKRYAVRIHGHPSTKRFACSARISEESAPSGLPEIVTSGGLAAHTEFHVIEPCNDGTSLVEAVPQTDRTNQIRLHLWHLGHPVVGDPAWFPGGRRGSNRTLTCDQPSMCLHAWSISLKDPSGADRHFTATQPGWFDVATRQTPRANRSPRAGEAPS